MTDEKPKRSRHRARVEAAYRAGYAEGYRMGLEEVHRLRAKETQCEAAIQAGLQRLGKQPTTPRRRRKGTASNESGAGVALSATGEG